MITHITPGTTHGVAWSIVSTVVREPEYRASVDGRYLATTSTRAEAEQLIDEWVGELLADGLIETLEGILVADAYAWRITR